jgi:hypothetical protein
LAAFDNTRVTAEHPKLCLLTIAPEANIQLVGSDPAQIARQLGKEQAKLQVNGEGAPACYCQITAL